MAIIIWPVSPTLGQLYVSPDGDTWVFDGSGWLSLGNPSPGATGPAGPVGASGPTGETGPSGLIGLSGPTGPQGSPGPTGNPGPQGPAGDTFTVLGVVANEAGLPASPSNLDTYILQDTSELYVYDPTSPAADVNGWVNLGAIQGPIGLTGFTGPIGSDGFTGPTGPIGPTGLTGFTGPIGSDGFTGPTGPIGLQGITGDTGPAGADGASGPLGGDGATGPTGPNIWNPPVSLNIVGLFNIDLSAGHLFILTATAAATLTFSNATPGEFIFVIVSNSFSITLDSAATWFTNQGLQPTITGITLLRGAYDGTRMIVTSIENLQQV